MATRVNEKSAVVFKVKGRAKNEKGNLVTHFYTLDSETVFTVFKEYKKNHKKLENSVIDLPEKASKTYQKIGVKKVDIIKEKGVEYVQFSLVYIFRDQEPISTIDIGSNFKMKEINLEGTEYRYIDLFFTIVPSTNTIIADRKCYNSTIGSFLKQIFPAYLNPEDYEVDDEELDENMRVGVAGELLKDYEKVLKENFSELKNLSFTLAAPNKSYMNNISELKVDDEEESDQIDGLKLGLSIFGAFASEDFNKNCLPFTSLRIEAKLNDEMSVSELKKIKKKLKKNLLNLNNDKMLRSASVSYYDKEENEVVKAVRRGVTVSESIDVKVKDLTNHKFMWEKQRLFYRKEL